MPNTVWKGLSRSRAKRAYEKGVAMGKKYARPICPYINPVLRGLFDRGVRHGTKEAEVRPVHPNPRAAKFKNWRRP